MRTWRGSARFVSCLAFLLTLSGASSAQLAIVEQPGEPTSVEHAELAYATGDGQPVTWISLRLRRAPVALIAAIDSEARAEAAPDAWFSALETTTSPRVLPPAGRSDCEGVATSLDVTWLRGRGAAPLETELASAEDVEATLAEQGLTLLSPLPEAARYVVWMWTELDRPLSTRTLRVTGGSAPLALMPGSTFPVLLSTVTRGPMLLPDERAASELDVSYFAGPSSHSDYREQLDTWLEDLREPLLETRSHTLLLDWSIQGDFSVAPLVATYAKRAASELDDVDVGGCADALRDLRSKPDAGLEPTACGAARDAWLALKSASPALASLQRYALAGGPGVDPLVFVEGGAPRGPALRAKHLDDSACDAPSQPPVVSEPPVVRPMPARPPAEDVPVAGEQTTVVVEHHETTEVDCTGEPGRDPYRDESYESEPACSSDTSSTSDSSSDDSCSGDSSTSYETDDSSGSSDSCSGDSSSSSDDTDDSDDSCSGDSSSSSTSSSDSDTDCDGGPGSGDGDYQDDDSYDGDTCTGEAAPDRATRKSQAGLSRGPRAKRAQRLKTSLWGVAFAALVLPIRRRKRGARAAG